MRKEILEKMIDRYSLVLDTALWRSFEAELFLRVGSKIRKPVLDLGCGDGKFASVVFGKNEIDVGADISKEEIEKAKKFNVYKKLICADASSRIPYQGGFFATVVSNCVMEHIPNIKEAMKEVARVLKKGGFFIFTVPSEKFLFSLSDKKRKQINKEALHYNISSSERWRQLLKPYFKDIRIEYFFPHDLEKWWYFFRTLKKGAGRFRLHLFLRITPKKIKVLLLKRLIDKSKNKESGSGLFIIAKK